MADKDKKRILVVDDEPALRNIVQQYLREKEYETVTAESGEEGLELVASFHPHLIILDIMMPGIHGFDVLKQLKTNPATATIGVIMCSAKDYKPEKDLALQHGAYGYLAKPFSRVDLLTIVGNWFNQTAAPKTAAPAPAPKKNLQQEISVPQSQPFIRFWGTRGSIPVSGPSYVKHGGNTPCLEINDGQTTIIIDAGTGIRELGLKLMNEPPRPLHLFIGHTHWDHIQGFPFFTPAYNPGTSLTVYGASGFGKDLRSIFSGQLDADYFPVQLEDFPSSIEFRSLIENPVVIGQTKIKWEYVHHPGAAVGFRFELGGKKIVYMTDNEFLKGYTGPPDISVIKPEDLAPYKNLIEFISGADILIAESQYTVEEYPKKIGWGHTSLSNGCLLCKLGKVKRWLITHHDPMHTDDFLHTKLLATNQMLESINYSIPTSLAFDGLVEFF